MRGGGAFVREGGCALEGASPAGFGSGLAFTGVAPDRKPGGGALDDGGGGGGSSSLDESGVALEDVRGVVVSVVSAAASLTSTLGLAEVSVTSAASPFFVFLASSLGTSVALVISFPSSLGSSALWAVSRRSTASAKRFCSSFPC